MIIQNANEESTICNVSQNSHDVPDEFIDGLDVSQTWKDRFKKFSHLNTFNQTKLTFEERKKIYSETKVKRKFDFFLNFNILAAFFHIFYFIAKGMWRRGLFILGATIICWIVLLILQHFFKIQLLQGKVMYGFANAMCAITANRSYYLFKVKNNTGWF
jgi:Protein of unknown function (DUF2628)